MTDPLALPEAELARYLEAQLPGFRGPLSATKFKGGQSNPTYRIDAASGRYVLRRKPPGRAAGLGPCGGPRVPRAGRAARQRGAGRAAAAPVRRTRA